MPTEVKVPVLPESVSDATIASWHKKAGDAVKRDENLVDLETDKVVLEVPSPVAGVLKEIKHESGDTVKSDQLLALIEEGASGGKSGDEDDEDGGRDKAEKKGKSSARQTGDDKAKSAPGKSDEKNEDRDEDDAPKKAEAAGPGTRDPGPGKAGAVEDLSPAARRYAEEHDIDPADVDGSGRDGRVTKEDVANYQRSPRPAASSGPGSRVPGPGERPEERVPMTRIRGKIAERMMQAKNSIAMLTSFNEINLAEVMKMRKRFGEQFEKTHGVKLGFMSFFVRATCEALKRHPVVNASVDGNDIIYHGYQDISIAVSTERGLVTPVLRDAQDMSFADIESKIGEYAKKAREGGLAIEDLQGGTFTVTNGGVFGSLYSTPIVNPPQSAILGMHTIKERAIVENGNVVAAPMMYIAISYDHRIVDGKDAVLFLVDIKNQLENPQRMLLGL